MVFLFKFHSESFGLHVRHADVQMQFTEDVSTMLRQARSHTRQPITVVFNAKYGGEYARFGL